MKKVFQKGINPLIATVLLLLIALAISGLLYSWLASYTTEKTNQASAESETQFECGKASFEITKCDYFPNDGKIQYTLENKGSLDLNDWVIFVEYEDGNVDRLKSNDKNLLSQGIMYEEKTGFLTGKVVKKAKFVPDNCPEVAQITTNCK